MSVGNLAAVLGSGGFAKVDLLWQGVASKDTNGAYIDVPEGYCVFYATGNWDGESTERMVMATVVPTGDMDSSRGEASMFPSSGRTGQGVNMYFENGAVWVGFNSSSNPGARITKVYGIKL